MKRISEIECRSALIKSKLPASDYCINPYIGCTHGCVYCYARFLGRWKGHKEAWGTYVDVRINSPDMLAKEVAKRHPKGIILLGSMTDAYQPIERKYELTRKILCTLLEHDLSVSILTKSDLILRDIDIIKKARTCEVGLTITFTDDRFRQSIEPRATSIEKRLAALRSLHDVGVNTYAFIGPILPGLCDPSEIVKRVAPYVDYVMGESVNIHCGNWNTLSPIIRSLCPNLFENYKSIIASDDYWAEVEDKLKCACVKYGTKLQGFYRH